MSRRGSEHVCYHKKVCCVRCESATTVCSMAQVAFGAVQRMIVIMRMYAVWRESATAVHAMYGASIVALGMVRRMVDIMKMCAVWHQQVTAVRNMARVLLPLARFEVFLLP